MAKKIYMNNFVEKKLPDTVHNSSSSSDPVPELERAPPEEFFPEATSTPVKKNITENSKVKFYFYVNFKMFFFML